MFRNYLIKRLLLFIPTLWAITLLGFGLSKLAPGDPVALVLGEADQDRVINEVAYLQKRKELGLDKPIFYFSIAALSETDTLHKIPRPEWRELAAALTFYTGNWAWVNQYLTFIKKLKTNILQDTTLSNENKTLFLSLLQQLVIAKNQENIIQVLQKIPKDSLSIESRSLLKQLNQHVYSIDTQKTLWKNYLPVILILRKL